MCVPTGLPARQCATSGAAVPRPGNREGTPGALARTRPFPWRPFRQVVGWALLAYLVIGGMLEYVFVLDGTRGAMLALMSAMLAVFAVDVPMLLAFSVARYQPVPDGANGDPATAPPTTA